MYDEPWPLTLQAGLLLQHALALFAMEAEGFASAGQTSHPNITYS